MTNNRLKGFTYGAVAAASYGMNPLFALPLYGAGMSVDSVLFYRYFFAVVMLGILMKVKKQSFALKDGYTSAGGNGAAVLLFLVLSLREL